LRYFISSDNVVLVEGVYDEIAKAYSSASDGTTVTARLLNATGATTVGGPVACSYVDGTRGDFRGVFGDEVAVTKGTPYQLEVVITKGTYTVTSRNVVTADYYRGRSR
jgi:hypothetical protein